MENERRKKGKGEREIKAGKTLSSAKVKEALELRRKTEQELIKAGIKNSRTMRSMLREAVAAATAGPVGSTRRKKNELPLSPIQEDYTMKGMPSSASVRGSAPVRGRASVRGSASVPSSARMPSGKHPTRKVKRYFGPGTTREKLKMAGQILEKAAAAAAEEKAAKEKAAAAARSAAAANFSIRDLTKQLKEMTL